MTLSILIPSVTVREQQLNRLLHFLSKQIERENLVHEVEIVVYADNFETPTWKKRNELLSHANGEYLVFVDDDDSLESNYCRTICEVARTQHPDYIGYKVLVALNGFWSRSAIHSLKYDSWSEDEIAYYRDITHINPIRADIAKSVPFPEKAHAEDAAWADALRGKLQTEVFIDAVMYFYNSDTTRTLMDGDVLVNARNQHINWAKKAINQSCVRFITKELC